MIDFSLGSVDVRLGKDVKIYGFVNLYGCEIGDETCIGSFVEIQKGASIGSNATILCGVTICEGAILGAGSVVTKNVPAWTIVKGVPAIILQQVDHRVKASRNLISTP